MDEADQKELLNKLDQGYVGLILPKVEYKFEKEESRWDLGDNFPESPEQATWFDIND